ncbi:uncharacterized protein [Watersipora subatra]|uniref:uncharacterized protein n=1 Tax=Watersipora subatra TaxID=2589382 RepID=UPI00355BDE96
MADELKGESKQFIAYLNTVGELDMSQPVETLREINEHGAQQLKGDFKFIGSTEERLIPAKNGKTSHKVPVTILRPNNNLQTSWNKIFIFFHGGGFIWGSRETHMKFCEMIANRCNCVVVNVEYRLSPEHKFPACYDDAVAVVNWCQDNKKLLTNCDSPLVGVGGDSAGGNIAASVCHLVKGLAFQVLIYSSLTVSPYKHYPSVAKYSEGLLLTKEMLLRFLGLFLTNIEEATDLRCSPVDRKEFAGVPPALFIVSECDPLADQSTEYHKKLQAAGVQTKLVTLKGTIHGFVAMPGFFKETTSTTIFHIDNFLSKL